MVSVVEFAAHDLSGINVESFETPYETMFSQVAKRSAQLLAQPGCPLNFYVAARSMSVDGIKAMKDRETAAEVRAPDNSVCSRSSHKRCTHTIAIQSWGYTATVCTIWTNMTVFSSRWIMSHRPSLRKRRKGHLAQSIQAPHKDASQGFDLLSGNECVCRIFTSTRKRSACYGLCLRK
jgi:hypothetical protein